ncbi:MAG: hypothetical protein H0U17_01320 [Actinobacteria bacterium]|nr:hypothetical protein [Actinomycetota bacterium]
MADFTWTLQDEEGDDLRSTEAFATKEDAEAWMGAEWSALRAEGGEYVVLKEGDEVVYRMGLSEG